MSKDSIYELWSQPNKHLQKVAIGMITEGLPESFLLSLELLQNSPHEKCNILVASLRSKLPFLRAGFSENNSVLRVNYDVFGHLADMYHMIMAIIQKCQDDRLVKTAYYFFDGIRPDLRRLFPNLDFSGCKNKEETNVRQLMVFVTGVCNLQCTYCFSNGIMRQHISKNDINRIFAWANANECKIVTPCGGEPLLYRHLELFLALIEQYGMSTYFASNLTIPLPNQCNNISVIMAHVTESLWVDPNYMRVFCENTRIAQDRGIELIARVNITSSDMNILPWFEMIDRLGIKSLNIALTIPSSKRNNKYIDASLFVDFVPIIMKCIDECKTRGVNVSFAKPIPLCVFDESTAYWLLQFDNFTPLCNIYEDLGTKNLCLSPDLYFTPCLGISQPKIPFCESLTLQELRSILGTKVKTLLMTPLSDKCEKCFLYVRNLCQGACLSYKDFSEWRK